MSELLLPTTLTIPPPCLIDGAKLREFDELVERQWEKLEALRLKRIEASIDAAMQRRFSLARVAISEGDVARYRAEFRTEAEHDWNPYKARGIAIVFKSGKRLKAETFGEAFTHEDIDSETPLKFSALIKNAGVEADISLNDFRLAIDVSPDNLPESRELFTALRRWANSFHPTMWQRIWREVWGLPWMLYGVFLILSLGAVSESHTIVQPYRGNAIHLLQTGVSSSNLTQAVETLLALNTGYGEIKLPHHPPSWLYVLWIAGLLSCILLSFHSRSMIGLGKGEQIIKRFRRYHKFVTYTVPTIIFTSFIWPVIVKLVSEMFHLPR